jgi:hypothetical protein
MRPKEPRTPRTGHRNQWRCGLYTIETRQGEQRYTKRRSTTVDQEVPACRLMVGEGGVRRTARVTECLVSPVRD